MNPTPQPLAPREIIFAVTHAPGATAACATHGDVAMAALLAEYYALAARLIAAADGRVIKVMGDSILMMFPTPRAKAAVAALRALQAQASAQWHAFDPRCRTQLKVGTGRVLVGQFGPPGEEQLDLCGDALNRLFKLPWDDFLQTPEFTALLD